MKYPQIANTPAVVSRYFDAMNRFDAGTASACFTDDAHLEDQFGPHIGRPAIQRWMRTVFHDFQPMLLPLGCIASPADAGIAVSLSGRFPGSPVQVDFHFHLRGRQIERLTIDG